MVAAHWNRFLWSSMNGRRTVTRSSQVSRPLTVFCLQTFYLSKAIAVNGKRTVFGFHIFAQVMTTLRWLHIVTCFDKSFKHGSAWTPPVFICLCGCHHRTAKETVIDFHNSCQDRDKTSFTVCTAPQCSHSQVWFCSRPPFLLLTECKQGVKRINYQRSFSARFWFWTVSNRRSPQLCREFSLKYA